MSREHAAGGDVLPLRLAVGRRRHPGSPGPGAGGVAGRHLITLFARFYVELFGLLLDWTETAEAEVRGWPGTAGLGLTDTTREQLEALLARLEAMWASQSA